MYDIDMMKESPLQVDKDGREINLWLRWWQLILVHFSTAAFRAHHKHVSSTLILPHLPTSGSIMNILILSSCSWTLDILDSPSSSSCSSFMLSIDPHCDQPINCYFLILRVFIICMCDFVVIFIQLAGVSTENNSPVQIMVSSREHCRSRRLVEVIVFLLAMPLALGSNEVLATFRKKKHILDLS